MAMLNNQRVLHFQKPNKNPPEPWLFLHPSNARFTSFMGVEAAAMAWVAAASTSDSVGNRVSAAGTWAWGVTLTWSRLASWAEAWHFWEEQRNT